MTKVLTLDEMREIISKFDQRAAKEVGALMEQLGNQMAAMICTEYDLTCSATSAQEVGFGGTAASFYLAHEDQEQPADLAPYDPGEPVYYFDAPDAMISEDERDLMRQSVVIMADTIYRADFRGVNATQFTAVYKTEEELNRGITRRFNGGKWLQVHVKKVERQLATWDTHERVVQEYTLNASGTSEAQAPSPACSA